MKAFFFKIKYFFIFLALINTLKINADNQPITNAADKETELLIESNKQISDLENSVFYAEGDVLITNVKKEFVAKSKRAIFYKLMGKIQLVGNVEVLSADMNKIKADEVFYHIKENIFEASSTKNQKVKTNFVFNNNYLLEKPAEK